MLKVLIIASLLCYALAIEDIKTDDIETVQKKDNLEHESKSHDLLTNHHAHHATHHKHEHQAELAPKEQAPLTEKAPGVVVNPQTDAPPILHEGHKKHSAESHNDIAAVIPASTVTTAPHHAIQHRKKPGMRCKWQYKHVNQTQEDNQEEQISNPHQPRKPLAQRRFHCTPNPNHLQAADHQLNPPKLASHHHHRHNPRRNNVRRKLNQRKHLNKDGTLKNEDGAAPSSHHKQKGHHQRTHVQSTGLRRNHHHQQQPTKKPEQQPDQNPKQTQLEEKQPEKAKPEPQSQAIAEPKEQSP